MNLAEKEFKRLAIKNRRKFLEPHLKKIRQLQKTARPQVPVFRVPEDAKEKVKREKAEEELAERIAWLLWMEPSILAEPVIFWEVIYWMRYDKKYVDELEKVTSEDILRVAQKYLNDQNRVTIKIIPEKQ